jgi:hypothetical protein
VVSSIIPIDGATGLSRRRFEYADRHRPYVGKRVVVSGLVEPVAGRLPPVLRAVAEGEQRLLAAHFRAFAGDVEHLVRAEVRRVDPTGHGDESAVATAVPAQPGQRDEHLLAVGDDAGSTRGGQTGVADPARISGERVEIGARRLQQNGRLVDVERLAVAGPGQGAPHSVRAGLDHDRKRYALRSRANQTANSYLPTQRLFRLPDWPVGPRRGIT